MGGWYMGRRINERLVGRGAKIHETSSLLYDFVDCIISANVRKGLKLELGGESRGD